MRAPTIDMCEVGERVILNVRVTGRLRFTLRYGLMFAALSFARYVSPVTLKITTSEYLKELK